MANLANAVVKVDPSFTEPELIVTYAQASGFADVLADGKPRVKLGEGDLYVYINRLDLRTQVAAGQSAYNSLPSATLTTDYYSTPTYLIRTRAEYDHHDMAAMGRWNVSLPEAQRLAMRQGIFQQVRVACLYGFNPANGEGLLNQVGATQVTLPPDTFGNTTLQTYDNGQMAEFFLGQVSQTLTRMFMVGQSARVVILAPQRVLAELSYNQIVQTVSYQRPGAGTATTGQVVQQVLAEVGVQVEWALDDTLIGKGAGGNDAVVMVVPEVAVSRIPGINTNEFATMTPGMSATTLQYMDMAAPREIPTPLPGGAMDVMSELRITSGWCPRAQALTILSIPY